METPGRAEHSGSRSYFRGMDVIAVSARFARCAGTGRQASQHDEDVMQMNQAHRHASGWVQGPPPKVIRMIDKPGHPDRSTS
jgi:hypothetical protein